VVLVQAALAQLALGQRVVVGVLAACAAWCVVAVALLGAHARRVTLQDTGAETVAVLAAVALGCRRGTVTA
jgi:hypothetical protein